jgi:AcrR family transcriptional regulator
MRSDAARNHELVLAAAHEVLLAADDPAAVTMDEVAAAAGVGKGTLFRRFGDRVGLLGAVQAEQTEAVLAKLDRALEREDDPVERAVLVMRSVLRFKLDNRAVTLALESAGAGSPYDNPGYDEWHARLEAEVVAARGRKSSSYLAHALLAATRSDLLAHLADVPDRSLVAGVTELTRSVLT